MEQEIRLQEIFGAELQTRSRASEIRSFVKGEANKIIFNMNGIHFISRSFADELCNIMDDMKDKNFILKEQSEEVGIMLSKVAESRNCERKRGIANATILEFKDMDSLSSYLKTI